MTLYAGKVEAKFIGALHFRNLYKMMHDWIVEHEYGGEKEERTRHDYDFPEALYWESRSQPTGSEVWVWWRCNYVPEDQPFYRRVLRIDIHAVRMRDIEIMQDNKKYPVQWAEFKVTIHGLLETDYEKKWESSPLMKLIYNIFVQRIMWKDLQSRKKEVLSDMYKLQTVIKQFYDTQNFQVPEEPAFWPKKGMSELAPQRE